MLISGREKVGIIKSKRFQRHVLIIRKQLLMSLKIYKTIIQQRKNVLIVYDYMIADVEASKNVRPIVNELVLRGRRVYILLLSISQSHFEVLKPIKLNGTH